MWVQDNSGNWYDDGRDPEQDQYQYDPTHNPGGTGVGLPVPANTPGPVTPPLGPPLDPNTQTPNPVTTTATPSPTPTPNQNYSSPGYGGPWSPDMSYWQDAPNFSFDIGAPFHGPSLADAQNEPGYQFARDEGLRALTQSRAAQGIVRTGGTLKDLIGWGNKFADQNYGNVYNRAAGEYDRNLNNRFMVAKAEYEPRLTSWGTKMGAFGDASKAAFDRAWQNYTYAGDDAFRHWQTIYNGGLA